MFWLSRVSLLLLLAATSACSLQPSKSATLEQRAVQRWQYLAKGDVENAWGFLTPGYRASRTLEGYKTQVASTVVHWLDAKLLRTECSSDDVCSVTLELSYEVQMPHVGSTRASSPVHEQWLRKDGGWFHLPKAGAR